MSSNGQIRPRLMIVVYFRLVADELVPVVGEIRVWARRRVSYSTGEFRNCKGSFAAPAASRSRIRETGRRGHQNFER